MIRFSNPFASKLNAVSTLSVLGRVAVVVRLLRSDGSKSGVRVLPIRFGRVVAEVPFRVPRDRCPQRQRMASAASTTRLTRSRVRGAVAALHCGAGRPFALGAGASYLMAVPDEHTREVIACPSPYGSVRDSQEAKGTAVSV